MVQSSPQMSAGYDNIDWGKYANRWGFEQSFVRGHMRVEDLVNLVNNNRIRLSKSLDQGTIDKKAEGNIDGPVIITMPSNESQALSIVDGSHALVAAYNRKQEVIPVVVSQPAAKWLGNQINLSEGPTGSADGYVNQLGHDPEENGLHRPQYLKPMTIKSPFANKVFGYRTGWPKKKKKSVKSRELSPID